MNICHERDCETASAWRKFLQLFATVEDIENLKEVVSEIMENAKAYRINERMKMTALRNKIRDILIDMILRRSENRLHRIYNRLSYLDFWSNAVYPETMLPTSNFLEKYQTVFCLPRDTTIIECCQIIVGDALNTIRIPPPKR